MVTITIMERLIDCKLFASLAQKIVVVLIFIGLHLVPMEGDEGLSTASGVGSIQHIPFLFLRDIFLHFDVCTKFRLQR